MIISVLMSVRFYIMVLLSLWILPGFAETHHPQEFLKHIAGAKNEGEQIVQHFCMNCHAMKPLIPLGAPRIGNTSDWESRIKQNIDTLFKHTDEGFNAMPARGGCFECSDEQLILSILAMLPEPLKADCQLRIKSIKKPVRQKK